MLLVCNVFAVCGSIVCQNALVILCIKRLLIDRLNVDGLGEHVTDHVLNFFFFYTWYHAELAPANWI